jgi:hypothetical protein
LLSVDPRREQMASKKKDVGIVASLRYWQAEDARVVVEAWKESGEGLAAFVSVARTVLMSPGTGLLPDVLVVGPRRHP